MQAAGVLFAKEILQRIMRRKQPFSNDLSARQSIEGRLPRVSLPSAQRGDGAQDHLGEYFRFCAMAHLSNWNLPRIRPLCPGPADIRIAAVTFAASCSMSLERVRDAQSAR